MECHLLGEPVRIAELLSSPPPSPLTSSPSSGVELDDSHLGAMKRGPIGAVRTRATESDSASVPTFLETKERSDRRLSAIEPRGSDRLRVQWSNVLVYAKEVRRVVLGL